MEINKSISISKSPEKIWNFWMSVTTDVQWRDGITKAEWTSQPPYGKGSTGIHYHKDFGAMPWTIIRWEEGWTYYIRLDIKLREMLLHNLTLNYVKT